MASSALKFPVRLGPAEQALIDQLRSVGAAGEAERLETIGLPTRRIESYHYTDLKQLLRDVPPLASATATGGAAALRLPGATEFVIVNGKVFAEENLPAGVSASAGSGSALSLRDDILVRLNAALVRECLTLTLDGTLSEIVHIDRRSEGEPAHSTSAARLFVADGAEAIVFETYSAAGPKHVSNDSSFVTVGRNARLTHVTLDLSPRGATHFATTEYELHEGAQLRSLVIHAGSTLARSQVFARFAGKGAHADFTGLNLVDDGQHLDITLEAMHAVPGTTSKPLYKQIARGRSRAVFQGKLVVARDAQKTDAKLMMQGLMLSDEAEILSKPELEIYADDVVCGHGSTCGRLDEDSLFYLMSRGIPKAEAETMLVRGFIEEVLDPIGNEVLHDALEGVVEGWLLNSPGQSK